MTSEKATQQGRFIIKAYLPLIIALCLFCSQRTMAQACTAPDCEIAMASVEAGTPALCGMCSVTNEANVINVDVDDFATITVPVGVIGTVFISAEFGSTQTGGNYAGFVIEDSQGLLEAILLGTLTLTTYLADSQRESTSGAALSLHDVGGNRKAVEFLTSLSFDEVRIEVGSLADATNEVYAYYAYSSQAPLPVELVSFEALADDLAIELQWETASETNNAGFEVQQQAVDTGHLWEVIGWVDGQGTRLEPHRYRYRAELLRPGRYRFRLKQVDYDGSFEYSPEVEVAVAIPEIHHLSAPYPNPFHSEVSFSLSVGRQQHIEVAAYDCLGRHVALVYEGMMPAGATRLLRFEAGNLPGGVYLLRIAGESFRASQRVILAR